MLSLRAPAKINLTLEVLDRHADGYHGVRSVMVPLELADELTVEPSGDGFVFACDDPTIAGAENLAARAFAALSLPDSRLRVTLRKRIPMQAGLGGGSSDAAAVLLAAIDGAFGPLPERDWLATARALGSDVPFFLVRTGGLVEGTGERVTAIGALPPWQVLVVRPPARVSTAEAYARLDEHPRPTRPRNTSVTLRVLEALQRADFANVVASLHNDFHDVVVACEPSVAQAVAALRAAGAAPLLAGSGACVFALFESVRDRDEAARRLALPAEYTVFATAFAAGSAWRAASAGAERAR